MGLQSCPTADWLALLVYSGSSRPEPAVAGRQLLVYREDKTQEKRAASQSLLRRGPSAPGSHNGGPGLAVIYIKVDV